MEGYESASCAPTVHSYQSTSISFFFSLLIARLFWFETSKAAELGYSGAYKCTLA